MFPELDRTKLNVFLASTEADYCKRTAMLNPRGAPDLRLKVVQARRASGASDESLRNELAKALEEYLVRIREAVRAHEHMIYPGALSIRDEFGERENAIRAALILTRFDEAMEVASEMLEAHKYIMSAYMANEHFRETYQEGIEVGMAERDAFAFLVIGRYKEGFDALERSKQIQQKLGNALLPGPYFGREMVEIAEGNEKGFKEQVHLYLGFYNSHLKDWTGKGGELPFVSVSKSASLSLARYRGLIEDIRWLPSEERRWILWYWT
jgi:hypothetical protein